MLDFGGLFGGGGSSAAEEGLEQGRNALWMANLQTSNAAQRAMDAYLNSYNIAQGDWENVEPALAPYTGLGREAAQKLWGMIPLEGGNPLDMITGLPPGMGVDTANWLTKTPMYQFPFQEGLNALDRSAAARGMLLSGAQNKASQQFGQNFALTNALQPAMANYQNYLKNLMGMTEMGRSTALPGALATATGKAGAAEQLGSQMGNAQFLQAQLQNALAGQIASSYARQGLLQAGRENAQSNALSGLIGSIGGFASNILPLEGIGSAIQGGISNWLGI